MSQTFSLKSNTAPVKGVAVGVVLTKQGSAVRDEQGEVAHDPSPDGVVARVVGVVRMRCSTSQSKRDATSVLLFVLQGRIPHGRTRACK